MRPSKFTIEVYGEQSFDGFSSGEDWNGWACPYFTSEQAQRIVDAHCKLGRKAWYDKVEDQFVFDFSHDENNEPDTFPAEEVDGKKLYPVGAFCWIWEEAFEEVC